MELSFCIVNTEGRAHVLRCLDAVRDTAPAGIEWEVLVLDNASRDGSAAAIREWNEGPDGLGARLRLIELERRTGKAENDSTLLRESAGTWCLLLNEDTELLTGAVEALLRAVDGTHDVAVAGAQLVDPDGSLSACAWRLPGVGTAVAQALFLHKVFVTQSGGTEIRRAGWVQSAAMLVRREAAAGVGYLDPAFFVYSDETDFQKRLADAGWTILHVPAARAVHHEQLTHDRVAGRKRMVEFHRNRDLYMRKHHGRGAAAAVRFLTSWAYAVRAVAALLIPAHEAGWYLDHARLALRPQGEGIREAAERLNAERDAAMRSSGP
jgi:N-acetylglucosaminyl-diphospho-decaprenol L-rhamnosyltransferase